jgi:hypothetical protein
MSSVIGVDGEFVSSDSAADSWSDLAEHHRDIDIGTENVAVVCLDVGAGVISLL